jgi:hypothetical protein
VVVDLRTLRVFDVCPECGGTAHVTSISRVLPHPYYRCVRRVHDNLVLMTGWIGYDPGYFNRTPTQELPKHDHDRFPHTCPKCTHWCYLGLNQIEHEDPEKDKGCR